MMSQIKLIALFFISLTLLGCASKPESVNSPSAEPSAQLGLFSATAEMPFTFSATEIQFVTAILLRGELMSELVNSAIANQGYPYKSSLTLPASPAREAGYLLWFWGVNPPDGRSQQLLLIDEEISRDDSLHVYWAIEKYRRGLAKDVIPYLLHRMKADLNFSLGAADIRAIAPAMLRLQTQYQQKIVAVAATEIKLVATRFDRLIKAPPPLDLIVARYVDGPAGLIAATPGMIWQAAATATGTAQP